MIVSLQNIKSQNHMGHQNQQPCGSETDCINKAIFASMFNSIPTNHRNHTVRFRVTDQTESAIIYVAVVVVFYAAIIILLLGTNSRRPHRSRSRSRHRASVTTPLKDHLKQPTVAVYVDDRNRPEVQVQTENEEMLNHQLCVESETSISPL